MPIVEFIGPSGIGKSRLLVQILAVAKARNWSAMHEAISHREFAPRLDRWESFLLERKLRTVIATKGITVVEIYGILPFYFRKVVTDSTLRSEFAVRNFVDDDPFFHNFGGELVELFRLDPAAFSGFVRNRAFVFLRGAPERILRNVRDRQARGEYRVATARVPDTELLETIGGRLARQRALRDLVSSVGSPCVEIDYDYSTNGCERPVLEFIDRVFTTAGPATVTDAAPTGPIPPARAA
jgi:hypothetical protein